MLPNLHIECCAGQRPCFLGSGWGRCSRIVAVSSVAFRADFCAHFSPPTLARSRGTCHNTKLQRSGQSLRVVASLSGSVVCHFAHSALTRYYVKYCQARRRRFSCPWWHRAHHVRGAQNQPERRPTMLRRCGCSDYQPEPIKQGRGHAAHTRGSAVAVPATTALRCACAA